MPCPCVCSVTLQSLEGVIPPPLPSIRIPGAAWPGLGVLAGLLGESLSASFSAGADLSLSALASAKLALLGSVSASLKAIGFPSFDPSVALTLGPFIESLNVNLPGLPGGVPALSPTLNELGVLAGLMGSVAAKWGIDLTAPGGVEQLQAKLDAAAAQLGGAAKIDMPALGSPGALKASLPEMNAGGALSGSASIGGLPSLAATASLADLAKLDPQFSAKWDAQLQNLMQMTATLGLPLAPADPLRQLSALVESFTAMNLPPITVPAASLANTVLMFTGLANIQTGLGVNLLAPSSLTALSAALGKIDLNGLANLNLAGNRDLSPKVGGNLDVGAKLTGGNLSVNSVGLDPSLALAATIDGPTGALNLDVQGRFGAEVDAVLDRLDLGTLTALSQSLALASTMNTLGLPLPTSPCPACAFLAANIEA